MGNGEWGIVNGEWREQMENSYAQRLSKVSELFENLESVMLSRYPKCRSGCPECGSGKLVRIMKSIVFNWTPISRSRTVVRLVMLAAWAKQSLLNDSPKSPGCWNILDRFQLNGCPTCPKLQKWNLLMKKLTGC
jgi:hypothetical protein